LERSNTRNIEHALKRFGLTEEALFEKLKHKLSDVDFNLLNKNKRAFMSEPKLVANAYAFAALLDRFNYGSLSTHIKADVFLDQAINTVIAVSGKNEERLSYRSQFESQIDFSKTSGLDYFVSALAIGWQAKWLKPNDGESKGITND